MWKIESINSIRRRMLEREARLSEPKHVASAAGPVRDKKKKKKAPLFGMREHMIEGDPGRQPGNLRRPKVALDASPARPAKMIGMDTTGAGKPFGGNLRSIGSAGAR